MTPHAQKIIMRMLNLEYEQVAAEKVPCSNSGYCKNRSTVEQILALRLAQQQSSLSQSDLYIGFQDYSTFFMACTHDIMRATEEEIGIDPDVTSVIMELHREVTDKYET